MWVQLTHHNEVSHPGEARTVQVLNFTREKKEKRAAAQPLPVPYFLSHNVRLVLHKEHWTWRLRAPALVLISGSSVACSKTWKKSVSLVTVFSSVSELWGPCHVKGYLIIWFPPSEVVFSFPAWFLSPVNCDHVNDRCFRMAQQSSSRA